MHRLVTTLLVIALWLPIGALVPKALRSISVRDGQSVMQVSPISALIADRRIHKSFSLSLKAALIGGVLTALYCFAIVSYGRMEQARQQRIFSPGKVLSSSVGIGVSIPEVALGLGMLFIINFVGLEGALSRIVMAQSIISIAAGMGVMLKGSRQISLRFESAAYDVGASPIKAAWRVTLPLHGRLMFLSGSLAALLSFEDYVVAYFASPSGANTLPSAIVGLMRGKIEEAYALGAIMVLIALAIGLALIQQSNQPNKRGHQP